MNIHFFIILKKNLLFLGFIGIKNFFLATSEHWRNIHHRRVPFRHCRTLPSSQGNHNLISLVLSEVIKLVLLCRQSACGVAAMWQREAFLFLSTNAENSNLSTYGELEFLLIASLLYLPSVLHFRSNPFSYSSMLRIHHHLCCMLSSLLLLSFVYSNS